MFKIVFMCWWRVIVTVQLPKDSLNGKGQERGGGEDKNADGGTT